MSAKFATEDLVHVDREMFKELKEYAMQEPLKRYRYCLHKDHTSPIQEMIIALSKESYVQPHRHLENRVESYCILEGELDVFIFDNEGKVIKRYQLAAVGETKVLRIGNGHWHMPVAKSDWVIYHEILQGPFDKDEVVEYANWAPDQDSENCIDYRMSLYE